MAHKKSQSVGKDQKQAIRALAAQDARFDSDEQRARRKRPRRVDKRKWWELWK